MDESKNAKRTTYYLYNPWFANFKVKTEIASPSLFEDDIIQVR